MPGYKAVIFDFDDTLVCSVAAKWLQHQTVARERYGVAITEDDLRAHWGKPFLELVACLYGPVDEPEKIAQVVFESEERFPKTAFDGAADAVTDLLAAGIAVGIVTSAPAWHVTGQLALLGHKAEDFEFVHGEESVDAHKPDPRVFQPGLKILAAKGIRTRDTVYVGDLLVDFEAARSAGMDFIGVTTGLTDETTFKAAGAETVASTLRQVVAHVITPAA